MYITIDFNFINIYAFSSYNITLYHNIVPLIYLLLILFMATKKMCKSETNKSMIFVKELFSLSGLRISYK